MATELLQSPWRYRALVDQGRVLMTPDQAQDIKGALNYLSSQRTDQVSVPQDYFVFETLPGAIPVSVAHLSLRHHEVMNRFEECRKNGTLD